MLPKVHVTSYSRLSGSRWVITPSWLSGSWRSFLYCSSVYSWHLLISSASIRYIPFCPLSCPSLHEMFPWYSDFLEEISSLSHSIVFLYFFALISEEGFLICLCYSWSITSWGFIYSVTRSLYFLTTFPHLPTPTLSLW